MVEGLQPRSAVLVELVHIDLECRLKTGEPARVESYLERFPELSQDLWDAATGKPIGPSLQHQGPVYAVAFGPDGKTVLTGSSDKTA